MLNGFQILHGGISYSLSDSALAFASNSYGNKCVSIETSISHTRPAKLGDILIATCKEIHRGNGASRIREVDCIAVQLPSRGEESQRDCSWG